MLRELNDGVQIENASVVMLVLTLQFIRPLRREKLIADIYHGMHPNGCLILVEKVLGEDSLFNRQFIKYYYDMKRRHGYSEMEISQKREALENVLIPYKLLENRELLLQSGFSDVDVFFKWYNFCGIVAVEMMVRIGNFLFRYRNALSSLRDRARLRAWAGDVLLAPARREPRRGHRVRRRGPAPALRSGWTTSCAEVAAGRCTRTISSPRDSLPHSRNPLYVGNLLIVAGLAVAADSLPALLIAPPLFLFAYHCIVSAEEEFLLGKFGDEFRRYWSETPRFGLRFAGLARRSGRCRFTGAASWSRNRTLFALVDGDRGADHHESRRPVGYERARFQIPRPAGLWGLPRYCGWPRGF